MPTAQGFAYVQFGSREALESAIALDGADFQKRKIIIAESRPPPTSSGERGGRGGRGRGRHDNFGGGRGHQNEYDRGDHRQGSHSYAGQSDGHFAAAPGAGHRHQLDVADAGESCTRTYCESCGLLIIGHPCHCRKTERLGNSRFHILRLQNPTHTSLHQLGILQHFK